MSFVGCYANLEQIINHELVPDKNKRADMEVRFENSTQGLVDVPVVHPGANHTARVRLALIKL